MEFIEIFKRVLIVLAFVLFIFVMMYICDVVQQNHDRMVIEHQKQKEAPMTSNAMLLLIQQQEAIIKRQEYLIQRLEVQLQLKNKKMEAEE
jgi:uncharacterized protein HemX